MWPYFTDIFSHNNPNNVSVVDRFEMTSWSGLLSRDFAVVLKLKTHFKSVLVVPFHNDRGICLFTLPMLDLCLRSLLFDDTPAA